MKSFFEKLTGASNIDDEMEELSGIHSEQINESSVQESPNEEGEINNTWMEEEAETGELTIDMYQTPSDVIIKTMVAGVKPDDLDVSITRDMVTITGERSERNIVDEKDYFSRELYWGSFSRTITLPEEIDIEGAEAKEEHGLLVLTLPKVDKEKQTKVKVKSSAKH